MNDPWTREELEAELGSRLKDREWVHLVDQQSPEAEPLADAVAYMKEQRRVFGPETSRPDGRDRGARGLTYLASNLLEHDLRTRAVSRIAAHEARSRDEVQAFRRTQLSDNLLTEDEAQAWLTERQADPQNRRPPYGAGDWSVWDFPPGLGDSGPLTTWDRFYDLVGELTLRYGWREPDAQDFLLTDRTPPVYPIFYEGEVPVLATRRIRLSIDLAATPKDVAEFYKRVRKTLVGRTRRRSDRQLALAEFVGTRPPQEPRGDTMSRWNRECPNPEWRYPTRSNFWRDAKKAFATVVRAERNFPDEG